MRCTFSRYKHGTKRMQHSGAAGSDALHTACTAEYVPDARRASHKRVGQEKDGAPATLETAEETPAEGAAEMAESEMAESEMAEPDEDEEVTVTVDGRGELGGYANYADWSLEGGKRDRC